MSGNMTVSGSNSASGVERFVISDKESKVRQDSGSAAQSDGLASVLTTKDLKQAELSGDDVSLGMEQMIKAIERANKALLGKDTSIHFSIHDETKQIMVKVVNKESGETVREFPSEKILDLVAKMMEMSGVFVDERR